VPKLSFFRPVEEIAKSAFVSLSKWDKGALLISKAGMLKIYYQVSAQPLFE
jgi:hypothetical protein